MKAGVDDTVYHEGDNVQFVVIVVDGAAWTNQGVVGLGKRVALSLALGRLVDTQELDRNSGTGELIDCPAIRHSTVHRD